ncbi:MAG: hypothetical protein U9R58_10460, partial [Chloroflexota bacterium]|nr:hypothetical protein [Chloroflexota bacterium]
KSDEILNSPIMKDIPRRGTIESAAVAGGLGRVYTNLYGFLSMIAHGKAFGLREKSETEDELFASISAALGAFECIEIITYEWITYRKQTPKETLTRLLGF